MIDCVKCGPVLATRKPSEIYPRCSVGTREQRNLNSKTRSYSTHGLSYAQAKVFKEGKSCEICGITETLVVDHDHETGLIRGVLCRNHNNVLGRLGDNLEGVMRLVRYLEKN